MSNEYNNIKVNGFYFFGEKTESNYKPVAIMKGKEYKSPGIVYSSYLPISIAYEEKPKLLKIKEWLKKTKLEKNIISIHKDYGIDAEEEITKYLTEEISKVIKKENLK